jgi:aspartyl-tRNA synthetase
MAIYNELPVYKSAYDLLLELFAVAANLSKAYRYSLGERLQNEAVEVIVNIYKANSTADKIPFITKSREHTEIIRLFIRILHDTRQISLNRMVMLNKMIEDLSRQLVGWQKYCSNNG